MPLYRNHLFYVLDGTCHSQVLQTFHDDPFVAHFRVAKTLALLSWGFWWSQPWKLVTEFIETWDVCARSKENHHRPYGRLHPLLIPRRPWASLSMDFTTDLPQVVDHVCHLEFSGEEGLDLGDVT